MLTQYEKFKAILREMFQMDQADLDFGIYRIMNAKRDEIEKFLDNDLLPQVSSEFVKYRGTEIEEKKRELIQLEVILRDSGMNPDESPKVKALREDITKCGDNETLSNDVFSHLSAFFRRYYDNGDFLSLRRYKKDTYAIPYEGEEVKLHWANADQYYIKTSEYLRDYAFRLADGKRAHFKLIDATEEKDNIKQEAGKERKFKLHEDAPVRIEGDDFIIQFVYLPDKEKQDKHNQNTIAVVRKLFEENLQQYQAFYDLIREGLAKTDKNPRRTLLEKHLYSYTARFNFDFFIHKDLGGFLNRELDFYVKNEVLFVDDLDAQDDRKLKSVVAKVKVIKHIAQKIITFLSSLEDFQKKLWLKKKFVVNCGWCVTLDKVHESLYPEIVNNAAQREEWVKLFAIDEIHADITKPGYSDPLTVNFLKANPYLVLDTKHFNDEFKEKLLASFKNLDETCNGVIINSENFQAMNLLLEKYQEQVKCVYIDPPYNAQSSEIVYKNSYKHSSWLSLMQDRMECSKAMLLKHFVYVAAIDEVENMRLGLMLADLFNGCEIATVSIQHNPNGQQGNNFSFTHEFAHFVYPENINSIGLDNREDPLREAVPDIRPLRNVSSGENHLRTSATNCFYPVFIKNGEIIGFGDVCDNRFHPVGINVVLDDGIIEVYPIDPSGAESKWVFARDTVETIKNDLTAEYDKKKRVWDIIRKKTKFRYKSLWAEKRYSANSWGSVILNSILPGNPFTYPKSIYTVIDCIDAALNNGKNGYILDYFAGSGTTAHAVINLNREDTGKRKYILVEMGEYFETVLKPRIQKVVYSKDWKDGKPVSREGSSHMFKYMRLEGYDDALDNLEVVRTQGQQNTLEKMTACAREDYQLRYMLDIETRGSDSLLNIDRFSDPFNYTLKIRKDNELKEQKIDLVETFNYLIGLYVEQTETIRGFKVVRGKLRTGEKTLVIWRNTGEKTNEDLNEFFKKQKYNTLDFEFDLIFVNGDNNLENLKIAEDKWKVRLIEEEFKKRMWNSEG